MRDLVTNFPETPQKPRNDWDFQVITGIGVMGANGPRAEWIESPTPLSAIEWKEELNKRWTEVANDPRTVREEAPNRWQFWMTLGVQSALDEELLPAQGLDTGGRKSLAVFARQTAAFGTVRRTLRIDRTSMMMMPDQCWMDVLWHCTSLVHPPFNTVR